MQNHLWSQQLMFTLATNAMVHASSAARITTGLKYILHNTHWKCGGLNLTLFYSPKFGLFSVYYEAHIHYVSVKGHRRNKYYKSYINGKSIDWSLRWDQIF